MRYIKVFLLVLLFFVVMLFFVQNQEQFSNAVSLKFDPMVIPQITTPPVPRYALLLICFTFGALVVLAMLGWDRITLGTRLSASRHRVSSLQKQLEKAKEEIAQLKAEKEQAAQAETASA